MPPIATCLWFDTQGLEAAEFYCSVFPNSRITQVVDRVDGEGSPVLHVSFELDGRPFSALNGGPQFTFDFAISIDIRCADQAEVDHYWDALRADGGEELPCGWLRDRFGLSWQIVPQPYLDLLAGEDHERAARATQAMYDMKRLDLEALLAA